MERAGSALAEPFFGAEGAARALERAASVGAGSLREVPPTAPMGMEHPNVPGPAGPEIHWQFARTELANERTFLAWVRTALSLFGIGFGILKVEKIHAPDDLQWYDVVVGILFLGCAVLSFLVGVRRYHAVNSGVAKTLGVVNTIATDDLKLVFVALAGALLAAVARTIVCLAL